MFKVRFPFALVAAPTFLQVFSVPFSQFVTIEALVVCSRGIYGPSKSFKLIILEEALVDVSAAELFSP